MKRLLALNNLFAAADLIEKIVKGKGTRVEYKI
jgi:hypothetical protein